MAVRSGYSGLQIGLHWVIAVLIVSAWWTGDGARSALDAFEETAVAPGFVPHVALGLAILALVVLRVIVRLTRGAPEAPGVPGSLPVRCWPDAEPRAALLDPKRMAGRVRSRIHHGMPDKGARRQQRTDQRCSTRSQRP